MRSVRFVSALVALVVAGCADQASAERGETGAAPGGRDAVATAPPPATAAVAPAEAPPAEAEAGARAEAPDDPMALDGSVSTSVGSPNHGKLIGGVPFPAAAPGVVLNPRRLNPGGHHGTVETVQALLRAAATVHRELPGTDLVVNDLSFAEGGPIPHHGSHESGRDVDVLFYLLDREGGPLPSKGVPLDTKGRGFDFNDLLDPADDVAVKLDVRRTWRFLQALAEDEAGAVQRVYVAEHLRTILVDHAVKARAPRAARERVEMLTCQPGTPHDDHFHIRFYCTPEDIAAGCEDTAPVYPWRRAELRRVGARPLMARPRPRPAKARTVSAAAARAAAGPMHPKVKAFLTLRETWSPQPHPGRPYCP